MATAPDYTFGRNYLTGHLRPAGIYLHRGGEHLTAHAVVLLAVVNLVRRGQER